MASVFNGGKGLPLRTEEVIGGVVPFPGSGFPPTKRLRVMEEAVAEMEVTLARLAARLLRLEDENAALRMILEGRGSDGGSAQPAAAVSGEDELFGRRADAERGLVGLSSRLGPDTARLNRVYEARRWGEHDR
jgi:hypothetical protein